MTNIFFCILFSAKQYSRIWFHTLKKESQKRENVGYVCVKFSNDVSIFLRSFSENQLVVRSYYCKFTTKYKPNLAEGLQLHDVTFLQSCFSKLRHFRISFMLIAQSSIIGPVCSGRLFTFLESAGRPPVRTQAHRDPWGWPEQPGGDRPARWKHLRGVLGSPGDLLTSDNAQTATETPV